MNRKIVSSFSERLKECLETNPSFTATSLADEIGLSKQAISMYISGDRNPKRPTVKVMAEVLNVDEAWLMGYDVPMQRNAQAKVSVSNLYNTSLSKNIKNARAASNKTLEEVAAIVGVSRQTIQKYENGVISNIPSDKVELLAKALDTTPSFLMGWESGNSPIDVFENVRPVSLKRFPLLGEIACGEPIFADEDRESYILAGADIRADFCLKAKGDSMVNVRILDGDIVFIREQSMVSNGEIAAVIIDGEATLKRVFYYPDKDLLILKAENTKYDDFIYSGSELDQIRILGKAVAFQSDVT